MKFQKYFSLLASYFSRLPSFVSRLSYFKDYLILLVLFISAALFNSQMDIIQFNPSRAWFTDWWIEHNWQQPWIQKYLLGWTVDGWHFCKILFLTSLLSMVGYMLKLTKKQKWYLAFLYTIILLIAWGLLFEVFYLF